MKQDPGVLFDDAGLAPAKPLPEQDASYDAGDAVMAISDPHSLVVYALQAHRNLDAEWRQGAADYVSEAAEELYQVFHPYSSNEHVSEDTGDRVIAELVATAKAMTPDMCRLRIEGLEFECRGHTDQHREAMEFYLAQICATCGATRWQWIISPETLGWHLEHRANCALCAGVKVPFGARLSLADLGDLTAAQGASLEAVARADKAYRLQVKATKKAKATAIYMAYFGEDPTIVGGNAEGRRAKEAYCVAEDETYQEALVWEENCLLLLELAKVEAQQAETDVSLHRAFMYNQAPKRPH